MPQGDQVGEAQAGQPARCIPLPVRPPVACREGPKVAVRKRQHDQIGRGLPQVERCVRFLQPVAFAKDDVHQPSNTARIAASSMW